MPRHWAMSLSAYDGEVIRTVDYTALTGPVNPFRESVRSRLVVFAALFSTLFSR